MDLTLYFKEDKRQRYSFDDYISASDILYLKGLMSKENAKSFASDIISSILLQFNDQKIIQSKVYNSVPYILAPMPGNKNQSFHRNVDGKLLEYFVGLALKAHLKPRYAVHDFTEHGVFDFLYEHPFGYDIYFEVKWLDREGFYLGSNAQAEKCARLIRNDVDRGIKTIVFYIMISYDCKSVHIVYPQRS